MFAFTAHATSTGACTLNVNALGAGNLLDSRGNALGAGDIQQNGRYLVVRTGTAFRVIGHLGSTSISAGVVDTFNSFYTAGGTADALTITTGYSLSALTTGMVFGVIPSAANTGAATLDVDGIGAVALEDYTSAALSAGDLANGQGVIVYYTGSEFRIVGGIAIDIASQVVGTLAIANGGTGQTSAAAAFSALKQSATTSASGVVELATDAEVKAAASGKVLTTDQLESVSALTALSDGASIALDWDDGPNFSLTLGGNRALANPTNGQPGTWSTIVIDQDGTGSRTLSFGNQYNFAGGSAPTLTTDASARDMLMIYCVTSSYFIVFNALDIG
ncbi:MAG: hypothetical protein P8Y36_00415 [Alphaproteobacteria bacterium]